MAAFLSDLLRSEYIGFFFKETCTISSAVTSAEF